MKRLCVASFFALFAIFDYLIHAFPAMGQSAIAIESRVGGGRMRNSTIVVLGVLLFAAVAQAKEKDRSFTQPCSVVFPIAEKMASEKPYKLQLDGKTDMNLIVETGSFWKAGAGQIIVQFSATSAGTCTVTDNSPYSGVRRNGTQFLDRLEKRLAESGPTK